MVEERVVSPEQRMIGGFYEKIDKSEIVVIGSVKGAQQRVSGLRLAGAEKVYSVSDTKPDGIYSDKSRDPDVYSIKKAIEGSKQVFVEVLGGDFGNMALAETVSIALNPDYKGNLSVNIDPEVSSTESLSSKAREVAKDIEVAKGMVRKVVANRRSINRDELNGENFEVFFGENDSESTQKAVLVLVAAACGARVSVGFKKADDSKTSNGVVPAEVSGVGTNDPIEGKLINGVPAWMPWACLVHGSEFGVDYVGEEKKEGSLESVDELLERLKEKSEFVRGIVNQ